MAGDAAEQNRRNLRRDGCRKTEFVLRERQNVDLAATSPNHRILKVEFFDLVKEPIPGTNPVEYQTITKPSTHKGGPLNLQVATLGATASVYWEKVSDTHTVKYTYTPFTSSKGRNYFAQPLVGVFNETEVELIVVLTSDNTAASGFVGFTLPRVKLGGASKSDGQAGIVQTMPFAAAAYRRLRRNQRPPQLSSAHWDERRAA